MAAQAPSHPSHPLRPQVVLWVCVAAAVALIGVVAVADPELQMFVVLGAIILGLCALWIPRAVRRDRLISARFLWIALLAHMLGALMRYWIILSVYNGVADANGYAGNGSDIANSIRHLTFPEFPAPGTPFMNWLTGIMFLFTGVTMLGGFIVCATVSFFGSWFFYRAHRVAFPDGNPKLYALLIFFVPTMWYWPSSLGKDAVIVFFMGLATFGFARLLTGRPARAAPALVVGMAGTFWIRPPIAAVLIAAGIGALALRPPPARSIQMQALVWVIVIPLFLALGAFALVGTNDYLHGKGVVEAFEEQQATQGSEEGGTSNFEAPSVFTPLGFPTAIVTTSFRPFPWEAGGLLPTLAALEGIGLIAIILWHRRELWRGLKTWRTNGMVIFAVLGFLGVSIALSALPNFGLLARQRVQILPFLLMLPTMVAPIARGRRARALARERAALSQA